MGEQLDPMLCATWVAAIGTVVAAIGTVAAVTVSLRQNWKLQKERQQELEVEQAKRVFCLFTSDSKGAKSVVCNPSKEPLYDVTAWFDQKLQGFDVPMTKSFGLLRPGGEAEHTIGTVGIAAYGRMIAVTFRDNAGRWWRKSVDGGLDQLPGKPDDKGA